jgi:hypothetical protein
MATLRPGCVVSTLLESKFLVRSLSAETEQGQDEGSKQTSIPAQRLAVFALSEE